MFAEEFSQLATSAKTKSNLLERNPLGYVVSAMMSGIFVGFGVALIFTIGGYFAGAASARILMGASFAVALSLVIIAGSELFTGNNLVMTAGVIEKKVTMRQCLKVLAVCYVGNWLGSILFAFIFLGTGLFVGATQDFIHYTASYKASIPIVQLFLRALLCNILVCLASWCSYKCKSETSKLIMTFWCLLAFYTTGFEHSIANMSLFTISFLADAGSHITLGGYLYNILVSTIGNVFGGVMFVAVPYYLISRKSLD